MKMYESFKILRKIDVMSALKKELSDIFVWVDYVKIQISQNIFSGHLLFILLLVEFLKLFNFNFP